MPQFDSNNNNSCLHITQELAPITDGIGLLLPMRLSIDLRCCLSAFAMEFGETTENQTQGELFGVRTQYRQTKKRMH